ncbi:TIR domain-containing protein [Burkholderia gladioli]|uniref:TIR domain-containing protein n=1 Tax=Burkholderia gladioli TaxID=28095 RepID=UPI0016410CB8|nr:nucleotide-binding protein [Burkholderia gladioli]
MRSNDYYNLIVSSEEGHWDRGEGTTPKARFHYRSVEAVAARFPMSDAVEMTLKSFPAVFACEGKEDSEVPAIVGRITRVEHRSDTYYLHFERDPTVPPIPQGRLLELADALDIATRGFGDLGCTHWSVKQVDLYSVLARHDLIVPEADVQVSDAHPRGQQSTAPRSAYLRRLDVEVPQELHPSAARVFIVHGHDEAAKFAVQALLGRLGLEGVILDEQTGRGSTIIEKFEREAGTASFAVVLLTPDDKGGVATATVDQLRPRARQNVILELGYFAAKLGRGRVCALHRGNVEIPSDFSGVLYVNFDGAGAWKLALAKEMRDAGLPVDLNNL